MLKSKIGLCLTYLFLVTFLSVSFLHDASTQQLKVLKNPIHIDSVNSNRQENGSEVFELKLEIAKNHFLYLDELLVVSELENLNNASFEVEASPIVEFKDKFSNYELKKGLRNKGSIAFKVPFGFNFNSKFKLSYKVCTKDFCYLPKTLNFEHGQISNQKKSKPAEFSFFGLNLNFNSSSYFLIFLIVFLAGILTSFTPCIFPLVPITLALIQNNLKLGRFKSFQKTLIFVIGIATTYSLLGILAASTGTFFGQLLSNTYVLIVISLIYFLMAFSLFGFFEIQIFQNLQNRFSKISTQSNIGVFLFGIITGIFASPCVGPILIAVLTYAAQSKNMSFSFFLLFTYALGLGQIFLLLSLFSNLVNKLPRSGQWLNLVKYALGALLILAGLFFFVPAVKSILKPETTSYQLQLEKALASKKIVIVDFKADWCGACKELEYKTFIHPEVKAFLDKNTFLPIDVTVTNDETSLLLQKYNVIGLPHVMFFDENGILLPDLTISSYINAKEMLEIINSIKSKKSKN